MTADSAAEKNSRLSLQFADITAKACGQATAAGGKTALQRNKNNKHCILRRTRTKIHLLVGDTPSPEMTAQRSEKNRLTPK
ncbi:MAG TPA: hypothetical protein DD392_02325 [Ruminococcus sp.]|nr:hypothetical protein [Ruminococcus sp.]